MDNNVYKSNKSRMPGDRDVDLVALFKNILKRWWIILLAAVIVGLTAFLYARFFVKPTYQASFTAYVNNKQAKHSSDSLTNSDIQASQELVRTYSKILTSNTVLMKVADLLDSDYTHVSLSKMVTTQAQNDTEIINVLVRALSKEEAYRVCAAIETISPDCMAEIIEGSSMKIVDTTQMPDARYSPSYSGYAFLGAIIGGFIMIAIITVQYFTNDTVTAESELEDKFTIPVVGIIPDMSRASSGQYGYYYSYYGRHSSKKTDEKSDNE